MNTQTMQARLEGYIKKNALGIVCECGGGGTNLENKTCKICNGCGIYNWDIFGLIGLIESEISLAITQERERFVNIVKSKLVKITCKEEINCPFCSRGLYRKCPEADNREDRNLLLDEIIKNITSPS